MRYLEYSNSWNLSGLMTWGWIGYPENETKIKFFTVTNNGKIFSDIYTIGG